MCRPNTRMSLVWRLTIPLFFSISLLTIPAATTSREARPAAGNPIDRTQLVDDMKRAPIAPASDEVKTQLTDAYGKVEMSFEENRGQTDDQVAFLARGGGYTDVQH